MFNTYSYKTDPLAGNSAKSNLPIKIKTKQTIFFIKMKFL